MTASTQYWVLGTLGIEDRQTVSEIYFTTQHRDGQALITKQVVLVFHQTVAQGPDLEPRMVWQKDKGKHRPLRHQTGPSLISCYEGVTTVPGASGLGLGLTDEFQVLKVP